MPRSITLDGVKVVQLHLMTDRNGGIHVYGEYQVLAGNQIVEAKHVEVTPVLSAANQAAMLAIFNQVSKDISVAELT